MLELTNHCNLACTTCPREHSFGQEMAKGTMTVNQAKKIIDELWPYLDSVGLTGLGETFLYKEIEEVVDYIKAKNKGIIISVSTNAMLPNFISRIANLINKIDTIQVSIDGLGKIYEQIRVGASFKMLDEHIREMAILFKNSETSLMLNMVVTKENYSQMPLLVDYSQEVGVDYLDFTMFNLASVTDIPRSYYAFYKSGEFLSVAAELEQKIKKNKKVTVTNRNFKTNNGFKSCHFPWSHFYISWNGFIPPCCAKPFPKELNFGNVKGEKTINVLNSSKYRDFRALWLKNETPEFCQNCHLIDSESLN